jgi:hypothetical protein
MNISLKEENRNSTALVLEEAQTFVLLLAVLVMHAFDRRGEIWMKSMGVKVTNTCLGHCSRRLKGVCPLLKLVDLIRVIDWYFCSIAARRCVGRTYNYDARFWLCEMRTIDDLGSKRACSRTFEWEKA